MPLRAGALAGGRAWIVRAMLGAAFGLLLGAIVGVKLISDSVTTSQAWIGHTIDVRREIERLKGAMIDIETGQRGYLLTGRIEYLTPYDRARGKPDEIFAHLRRVTADNSAQQARLERLSPMIAQRVAVIDQSIALARSGQRAAGVRTVLRGNGMALMDGIRAELEAMDAEESRLLTTRLERADAERVQLLWVMGATVLFSIGLGVGVFILVGRYVRELELSTLRLRDEMRLREQSDAQLRQAQKMESLGQLTGGIAHDFNNMLQIVSGSLQLLSRRLGEGADPQITKYVSSAIEGANRAAALTKRLLAFSRQQPLEPRATDTNRLVANLAALLERTLGGAVEIETVLAGGLWATFVDPPQLESALLNLAVNARDAMSGAGKITIETGNAFLDRRYAALHEEVTPGQYVMLAVTDTGGGMSPNILERVFEPFFTTKERGSGTGLGLSQVHGFVKQSGGHIKIYSEIGVGTTVKLYLPRHAGAAEPEAQPASREGAEMACVVLLVEDDPDVRAFAADALQTLGCHVIEAGGGGEALEVLSVEPAIQIMLTDVVMPEMSGRALADRALLARADLKIIFMTGFTQNAIVHNGVVDPGTRFLSKPFTLAQLEAELHAALVD